MEAYEHFLREEGIALLEGGMELKLARSAPASDPSCAGPTLCSQLDPEVGTLLDDLGIPHMKELFANNGVTMELLGKLPYTGMPHASVLVWPYSSKRRTAMVVLFAIR
jgi:hypothetical protein